MSKSVWVVLVMGLMAFLLLVLAMMFTLTEFQSSPAGMRTKLAEGIKNEFKFEIVGAEVQLEGPKRILRIAYETHADSRFDLTKQRAEMQRVAEFALAKYDGTDRDLIDDAKVMRSEVHGRGCFQQTFVAHHAVPNPRRRTTPFQPFPPQER